MNRLVSKCVGASLVLAAMALPGPAYATVLTVVSCQDLTQANAMMREHDAENANSPDPTLPWYESPNDSLYDYVDGSRIENAAQLGERLAASQADLHIIYNARFSGWDFTSLGDESQGLCFFRADLRNSRWDGLDLSRAAFVQSSLDGASMRQAKLERVLIDDTSLRNTKMQEAILHYATLSGGWFHDLAEVTNDPDDAVSLNNWDLTDADLTGMIFSCGIEISNGCPLERQINFTGANLAYTKFSTFPGWGEFRVSGAILDHTKVGPDQLIYFADARFEDSIYLEGKERLVLVEPDSAKMLLDQFNSAQARSEMASFDCNLAANRVEKMICSEEGGQYGLKREDRLLAAAYKSARQRIPDVSAAQNAWIRQRNNCQDYGCIESEYVGQIEALSGKAGPPEWIQRGEMALFVGSQPDVLPEFRSSQLWRWLEPVIADASDQLIVVHHQTDGTWSIRGRSIGPNAHICTIDQSGLKFDSANGWFALSSPEGGRSTRAFRIVGNELQILGNGHPDLDEYPDSDFINCGARASFSWSRHLKLSVEEVSDVWFRLASE